MSDYDDLLYDAQLDAAMEALAAEQEKAPISEIINDRFDKLEELLKKRDETIQKIFKLVKEIREEYRIDHPIMDKLSQMADEWGIEDFDPSQNT